MSKNFQQTFDLLIKNNRLAQNTVYNMYSAKMLAIAKSYLGNREDAEEVLLNSFLKAFTKIKDCKGANVFPYWLRKIVINESLDRLRKNKKHFFWDSNDIENYSDEIPDINEEDLEKYDIEKLLSEMPQGYRIVFNLYLFEEKKHHEISSILGISEGTSKSQWSKAKKWLSEFLKNKKNEQFYTKQTEI